MRNLCNQNKSDLNNLLAWLRLDVSGNPIFHHGNVLPDFQKRTILIGLGGMGVRTVDYIKGQIIRRMNNIWNRYVAFLGVDTSWSEFEDTSYLISSEEIVATKSGLHERMNKPESYPNAIRRFALDGEQMRQLSYTYSCDGAGQSRLTGKVKIHDKAPYSLGVDEEIVAKLDQMRHSTLEMLHGPDDMYQIYVIGSVCGGTCGGAMTEMPALIRKVFNEPHKVRVNAMLYLPDTMAHMVPANRDNLYACGYASLKELNYYMGMYMRPDYPEIWSYSAVTSPNLIYSTPNPGMEGFYDGSYLIGTTNGPANGANRKAMDMTAEYLISSIIHVNTKEPSFDKLMAPIGKHPLVGKKYFMPGIGNQREAHGEVHEFPKRFSTIGIARAAMPRKLVRAYTVGKACCMAGLKPVPMEERISLLLGNPNALLPFRAKDDLLTASEGTAVAFKLIKPLMDIPRIIHNGDFDLCRDLGETDITWTKIKFNQFDTFSLSAKIKAFVTDKTSVDMMDDLRGRILEACRDFHTNIKEYVREEGPYAFVNLYKGIFIPVDDNFGMGLGQMLQNLVNGKTIDGKTIMFAGVDEAKYILDTARSAIVEQPHGLLGIERSIHRDQCAKWMMAFNKWVNTQINEARRRFTLGQHGVICQNIMMPTAKLAEELDAFGAILEAMTEVYQRHGRRINGFQDFQNDPDDETEINMAAMNAVSYQWVKCKAEETLDAVNARKVRDSLLDHFFDIDTDRHPNSKKWLEFPQKLVKDHPNRVKLACEEKPVPARYIFDEIIADCVPAEVQLSIADMFGYVEGQGVRLEGIVHDIVTKLYLQSAPLWHGDIPNACCQKVLVYPSELDRTQEGRRFVQVLKQDAMLRWGDVEIFSGDDDSVMLCQVVSPLELYRLYDLREWERGYEYALTKGALYLHGKSPAEAEGSASGIPWADYPPITVPASDPRVEDPYTGEVSREGKLLRKLDTLIERARELGVLYSEQTDAGWIIKRVYCEKYNFWRFELNNCRPDPNTGLIPMGKSFAEAVGFQNDKYLSEMSRQVRLNMGGIMDMPHATEALAWEYAARTLRAHVPMYIEVCETVKKFEAWAEAVEDHNRGIMELLKPGMMVWMIKGRVLRRMDDGMWVYIMPDGTQKTVADLNDLKVRFMPREDRFMVNNGLVTYYLFTKLNAVLPDQKAFEEGYRRGQKAIQDLEATGQTDELAAGEELAAVLLEEIDALEEKGACMDGNPKAKPLPSFVQAMSGIAREKLTDISMFYAGMAMWKKL